ncbi:PA2778 family cysteine peptidase [Aliiglaciecola sp. LCG003]|uniref:PA2778 family cysteine peptidase n=1 Tax=Aliiglaciecola sp. LCG003 TaxID=3053655 RepID=UPI002573495C|nr:PA2778 family cysteine peptidase [Aliiglaciecola sp. LCG003]WJG09059.1 PA2778 family cysteine peptidase [Aliiglaciecola sp. LCG003]
MQQTQALVNNPPQDIAAQHLITDVPFYPQQEYYCGPTVLAEVLNFYQFNTRPDDIAAHTVIPKRHGTLQLEMVSTARSFGVVPYTQRGTLEQLIRLVGENKPVIVFQNLGISWIPAWHYAVVIGYDLTQHKLILHSGETANLKVGFEVFERTWQRGNYWLLALQPPTQSSEQFDSYLYIKASHELITIGKTEQGVNGLQTATSQWPDEWLGYFLLGNYYMQVGDDPHSQKMALQWFTRGLESGSEHAEYLNNYSYALANAGCFEQAQLILQRSINKWPENLTLRSSVDQIDKLQAQAPTSDAIPACSF